MCALFGTLRHVCGLSCLLPCTKWYEEKKLRHEEHVREKKAAAFKESAVKVAGQTPKGPAPTPSPPPPVASGGKEKVAEKAVALDEKVVAPEKKDVVVVVEKK